MTTWLAKVDSVWHAMRDARSCVRGCLIGRRLWRSFAWEGRLYTLSVSLRVCVCVSLSLSHTLSNT